MNLGLPELLVILVILLLVFGASRLPKLAKSLGEAGGELRKGFEGGLSNSDKKPDNNNDDNKKKT